MSSKKVLIDIKMIEVGIAPESSSGTRLREMLESLPQEDRRKAKRKFRKAWRKISKQDRNIAHSCGAGSRDPSPIQKRNRRGWVRRKIYQEIFQE